nr:MAG TPA: hypothetical protein [Caudoviricetes sp.]
MPLPATDEILSVDDTVHLVPGCIWLHNAKTI